MLEIMNCLDLSEFKRVEEHASENPNHLMWLNFERTNYEESDRIDYSITVGAEDEDEVCVEVFFPTKLFPDIEAAYDLLHVVRMECAFRGVPLLNLICINDHATSGDCTMGFGLCTDHLSLEKLEEELDKAIAHETEQSKPKLSVVK